MSVNVKFLIAMLVSALIGSIPPTIVLCCGYVKEKRSLGLLLFAVAMIGGCILVALCLRFMWGLL